MMIAVAICAVALACAFPGLHIPGRPKPGLNWWNIVLGLSELTVGLFSLTGGVVVASNWIRDRRAPQDPGCLLFLYCAFAFLLSSFVNGLFASMLDKVEPGDLTQGLSYVTGLLYVRCLTHIFLAFVCVLGFPRNRWWWQTGFLCLMFSVLVNLGITVMSFGPLMSNITPPALGRMAYASAIVVFVTIVWFLVCGVIDLVKKVKRSRIHWFGILCFLIFSLLPNLTLMIALKYVSIRELYGIE